MRGVCCERAELRLRVVCESLRAESKSIARVERVEGGSQRI
jgi:hypothetical protein